jgi:signal transduction histidine kinase
MRTSPIRIRTFILGMFLVLLLLPALAAGAGWLIEGHHQRAGIDSRLNSAFGYLEAHRSGIRQAPGVRAFVRSIDRLDLLAQLVVVTVHPPAKEVLYTSPALGQEQSARKPGARSAPVPRTSPDQDRAEPIAIGTRKYPATLVADLYYRPASRATRELVAVLSGVAVLLVGLAAAVWLAGRWMVVPLAKLSAQVDRVAGGDLAIAVPPSPIAEIANIAGAVEGMTAALGETAQQRAEADEARRFLVTSVAHDLRTPLFALRGHLQAIRSRLGDPAVHLERAEARADALERLIGNLFAYTRDDYTQPAPQLEAVPVAELVSEVAAGLEHAARLQDSAFELEGDRTLGAVVDRDRVKRALTNVLDNALRYSPAGAQVHVSWAPNDSTVGIVVRDEGPGIDPELLPHVFEPGIRGASTSDGGAGLGLTIAKRLLEHQHATLTVRNGPDGGAEVRVTLQRS